MLGNIGWNDEWIVVYTDGPQMLPERLTDVDALCRNGTLRVVSVHHRLRLLYLAGAFFKKSISMVN